MILKVLFIHSKEWLQKLLNNWLMITFYLRKEIDFWRHVIWIEIGHLVEVFSIMTKKVSLFGLTKKINSELYLCKMVPVSQKFSIVYLEPHQKLNKFANFLMTNIWVTSLLAQLILVLLWELPFISSFQN